MEEANQLLRDAALARKVILEIEFDVAGKEATQLRTHPGVLPFPDVCSLRPHTAHS